MADDAGLKRTFVLHTEEPRFLAEVLEAPDSPLLEPTWFDSPDTLDVDELKELMQAASRFYLASLSDPDQRN